MKNPTIGYLYSGKRGKDEKLFSKLSVKKNINLIIINILDETEQAILDKTKNCDLIYNATAEDFAIEIVKTLERLGKRVIDTSKIYYYIEDKWMFFLNCERNKIPTPKTILLSENINTAKRELQEFNQWPVILKRTLGTMGEFVEKAGNIREAWRIIKKFWIKGSERLPIIAQEMMHSPTYRVTAINGKIVQAAIKEGNRWKATSVYAKKVGRFSPDKNLENLVKKIAKMCNIKICGMDLMKRGNEWVVIEVNAEPAFDFFEEEREGLISKVLDFLKQEAKLMNKSS